MTERIERRAKAEPTDGKANRLDKEHYSPGRARRLPSSLGKKQPLQRKERVSTVKCSLQLE